MSKSEVAHNGNQDAVLAAVKRGYSEVPELMRATNLDENAVRNALRRLQDQHLVRRLNCGGYNANHCLLAETWR